jgi:hypothetical protein
MSVWTPSDKRWLKSIGSADDPIAIDWVDAAPHELSVVHFARNPTSVRVGDLLVYYAAVHQRIFGIVEVFTKPEFDAQLERWQYFCKVRPKLIIKDFDRAPSIDVLNVNATRDFRKTVMQMDYAELTTDEFDLALTALEAAYNEKRGDIRGDTFNVAR